MPISSAGSGGSGTGAVLFAQTLGADTATLDTLANGIAGGFNLIEIMLFLRTDEAAVTSTANFTFNNDTGANYDWTRVTGQNAAASANNVIAQANVNIVCAGATAPANLFTSTTIWVPGYLSTTGFKSGNLMDAVQSETAATMQVNARGFAWRNTAAITRFAITPNTGGAKFKTGSSLVVLGR